MINIILILLSSLSKFYMNFIGLVVLFVIISTLYVYYLPKKVIKIDNYFKPILEKAEINLPVSELVNKTINHYKNLNFDEIAKTLYSELDSAMRSKLNIAYYKIEGDNLTITIDRYKAEIEATCKDLVPNSHYFLDKVILDKIDTLAKNDYSDYNYLFKITDTYNNGYKLEFILNIPITPIAEKKITCIETDIEPLQCDICHKYKKDTVLNCGHIYCANCLLDIKDSSCPYCRQTITTKKPVFI
jgi:hypothetical protein